MCLQTKELQSQQFGILPVIRMDRCRYHWATDILSSGLPRRVNAGAATPKQLAFVSYLGRNKNH
jgi:hypothetical protein